MNRRFATTRLGVGCALLAALVGVAGCGIKRIPTAGTVTLDGKPLTEGVLQFDPDPSKGTTYRVTCAGPISDGKWKLVTSGMERADTGGGAPVGWFKVTYAHPRDGDKGVTTPNVAAKYRSYEKTPILIELTDPPPDEGYKIELTSK
jgi:hypothetical protein